MMKIFISSWNDKNTEIGDRLSKYNYGSRRNYSIDIVLLKKRLMYDAALRNGKLAIHIISDLKVCYNR